MTGMRKLLLGAAGLAVAALAFAAGGETFTVRRENVRLMKAPRFYGPGCGERLDPVPATITVVERNGRWARIAAPGHGKCWVHESAWEDRQPGELVGEANRGNQREIELAGRGFSEGEQSQYRAEHKDLDAAFKGVDDYVEHGQEPSGTELAAFAREGKLGVSR